MKELANIFRTRKKISFQNIKNNKKIEIINSIFFSIKILMAEICGRISNRKGESKFLRYEEFFPESLNLSRSGIIPFYIENNDVHFILGVDSVWGTLSDFAGQKKKSESILDCARREFQEETLGILPLVEESDLSDSYLVHDNISLTVFFIISKSEALKLYKGFSRRTVRREEMKGIKFLSSENMKFAVEKNIPALYIVLRELLFDHIDEICSELLKYYLI